LPGYRKREAQALDHARAWLDRIGLTTRADDPAGALPYGAQRRLEIARAMMSGPTLHCLDEPAAGLNPRESAELNELLRAIRDEQGASILLIEHDMSVVMQISDHVVVLDEPRVDRVALTRSQAHAVPPTHLVDEDYELAILEWLLSPPTPSVPRRGAAPGERGGVFIHRACGRGSGRASTRATASLRATPDAAASAPRRMTRR